jgi:hypothetical protein
MIKRLKVTEIVTNAVTQVRAGLNEGTVADYAEALADGAKFPPVVVFHDGSRFIAADGFHRIQAAIQTGAALIECEIRQGGKTEALKFALGCNAHHGLRRTNADKRHAVGLALREFPMLSDRALAEMCLVSHTLVAEIRGDQVATAATCPPESGAIKAHLLPPPRIGKDGKAYRLPPPPMRPRGTSPTDRTSGTDRTNATDAQGTPHPASGHLLPRAEKGIGAEREPVTPPPPPGRVVDGTGWPIPTQLIPLWQRAPEVQEPGEGRAPQRPGESRHALRRGQFLVGALATGSGVDGCQNGQAVRGVPDLPGAGAGSMHAVPRARAHLGVSLEHVRHARGQGVSVSREGAKRKRKRRKLKAECAHETHEVEVRPPTRRSRSGPSHH